MAQRLNVAALQPQLRWQQPVANMFAIRKMIEGLPSGTDVVVLPEMWPGLPYGYEVEKRSAEAEQFLQTLATACDVHVIGGSFERPSADGAMQNVCLIVDRHGEITGEYAKRVLFSREQEALQPGRGPGVFELEGFRIAVLICADLWPPEPARALIDQADLLCVPAKTAVPSDNHVEYARSLWHNLALTRAMENGLPVVVSDWAGGRHAPTDVDRSVGSVHAPGTDYDRGVLHKQHHDPTAAPTASGPTEPTATAHTSATPALGAGVHFTAGAACICNPAHRPDLNKVQQTLPRGEPGNVREQIDLEAVRAFRRYRRTVGLLPPEGR